MTARAFPVISSRVRVAKNWSVVTLLTGPRLWATERKVRPRTSKRRAVGVPAWAAALFAASTSRTRMKGSGKEVAALAGLVRSWYQVGR